MDRNKYLSKAVEELVTIIETKDKEIENLNNKIIDLSFELNYNKQTELIEFLRELYDSCQQELKPAEDRFSIKEEKSAKEILTNLINYIKQFCKDNKIKL